MTDKATIIQLLQLTGRPGIQRVICYLEGSDFFTTGCHTHHLGPGGLARHSLEVHHLMDAARALPQDTATIVAILHDIGTAKHPAAQGIPGHGARSVAILQQLCGLQLTDQEAEAILYHMTPAAPQIQGNQIARILCRADQTSAITDRQKQHTPGQKPPPEYAPRFKTAQFLPIKEMVLELAEKMPQPLQQEAIFDIIMQFPRMRRFEAFNTIAEAYNLPAETLAQGLYFAHYHGHYKSVDERDKAAALFKIALKDQVMPPPDLAFYNEICSAPAAVLQLFRGCSIEEYETQLYGLSWSLSQGVAEFFAWRDNTGDRGRVVLTTTIKASEALAAYSQEGDHEIVADIQNSTHKVEIFSREPSPALYKYLDLKVRKDLQKMGINPNQDLIISSF